VRLLIGGGMLRTAIGCSRLELASDELHLDSPVPSMDAARQLASTIELDGPRNSPVLRNSTIEIMTLDAASKAVTMPRVAEDDTGALWRESGSCRGVRGRSGTVPRNLTVRAAISVCGCHHVCGLDQWRQRTRVHAAEPEKPIPRIWPKRVTLSDRPANTGATRASG